MPKDLGCYWWINIYCFLVVCLKLLSKGITMIRLRPIIPRLSQALCPGACGSDELLDLSFLDLTKRWIHTFVGVTSCQTHHSWAQQALSLDACGSNELPDPSFFGATKVEPKHPLID